MYAGEDHHRPDSDQGPAGQEGGRSDHLAASKGKITIGSFREVCLFV